MNLIFIGSSAFGVPTLRILVGQKRHRLIGVITQPDSRKGRGLKDLAISPVKAEALTHALEVWQPKSINELSFISQLRDKKPDLIIVAAYSQKLGREILNLPAFGCINIHPSLLPKYRGSAPVNYAILNGDKQTGVSIIRMAEKMDAGPILKQVAMDIKDDETAAELDGRLAMESALVMESLLDNIENKDVKDMPQDETGVTFAPKLKKADGEIDWIRPAREIINQIRAMQPWPGAYTYYNPAEKEPLKIDILQAHLNINEGGQSYKPGTIAGITNNEMIISCGESQALSIMGVKPAGSRVLTSREFINGYRLRIGDSFGKEVK